MRVRVKKIGQRVREIVIDEDLVLVVTAVTEVPGTSPIYEIQPNPNTRVVLENTMLAEVKARGVEHTVFERHRL
jgi:hypothetical protein